METAVADVCVREALGLSSSMGHAHNTRTRWIGLRVAAQTDGSCRVVGVCHAHHSPHGCPGHALALRNLMDATACCLGCGAEVAMNKIVQRAIAGRPVLDASGQVTGWMCLI